MGYTSQHLSSRYRQGQSRKAIPGVQGVGLWMHMAPVEGFIAPKLITQVAQRGGEHSGVIYLHSIPFIRQDNCFALIYKYNLM